MTLDDFGRPWLAVLSRYTRNFAGERTRSSSDATWEYSTISLWKRFAYNLSLYNLTISLCRYTRRVRERDRRRAKCQITFLPCGKFRCSCRRPISFSRDCWSCSFWSCRSAGKGPETEAKRKTGKRTVVRGHETITGSPANFELGCERPVRWILLSLFLPPFPLSFFRSCFVVARVHTRPRTRHASSVFAKPVHVPWSSAWSPRTAISIFARVPASELIVFGRSIRA